MNTSTCKKCGNSVTFQNDLAANLAMLRGIVCDTCRRGKKRWTKATYHEYLKSPAWREFKARLARHYEQKCYVCGRKCKPEYHHNNYSRLGHELFSDVIPICRKCHQFITDMIQSERTQ